MGQSPLPGVHFAQDKFLENAVENLLETSSGPGALMKS
jgi:hypothetical protein